MRQLLRKFIQRIQTVKKMQCFGLFSKKKNKTAQQVQSHTIQQTNINNNNISNTNNNLLTVNFTPKNLSLNNNNQPKISEEYPDEDKNKEFVNTAGKVGKSHHNFFKQMQQTAIKTDYGPITLQQLQKHKTVNNAWLSLNGTVYDVTVYLRHHPGGNIILEGCGKECMNLFNIYHPWVNWKYLLEKYKVGYIVN